MHPGSIVYLCKGEHSSWEKKLKGKKQTHWRMHYKVKSDYGLRDLWEKVHTKYKRKKTQNTVLKYRITEELETIKFNACGLNPIYLNDWWTAQENKCISESCLISKDGGIGHIYPHFIKNGANPTLQDFP